jgi:hypothetical protein
VWYTKDKRVLKGLPGCFEDYIYQCSKCEGEVRRTYTDLDGNPTNSLVTTTIEGKLYKIFFKCEKCDHGGEVSEDYKGV